MTPSSRLSANSSLLEQRVHGFGVTDEFAMRERIGDEVAGGRRRREIANTIRRRQDRDGVIEHRRGAIEHLGRLDPFPVAALGATDGGGDDLEIRTVVGERLFQRVQKRRIGAIGHQDAQLAAFKAFRPVLENAQGR